MAGNQTIIMHPNGLGGSQSWSPSAPAPGGEPTLSAISGSFVQGSTMALSGSDFSEKRNGMLAWEDFENLTLGQPAVGQLPASFVDGGGAGPVGTTRYRVVNDRSMFGSKSILCDAPVGSLLIDELKYIFPAGTTEVLVSFWLNLHINVEGGSGQLKVLRFSGNRDSHTATPSYGVTWFSPGSNSDVSHERYFNVANTIETPGRYADIPAPTDQWIRVTQYVKLGTPGVADGKMLCVGSWSEGWDHSSEASGTHVASLSGAHTPQSWKMDNIVTRDVGLNTTFDACFFGHYVRETCSYNVYIDQIMINDSFESVWFGDAATWAACTPSKRVPQRVTSRSGAAINIEAQVGPLSTGPVYAYVFNADGQYNSSGLLVRAA